MEMLLGKKPAAGYQSIPTDDIGNLVLSPISSPDMHAQGNDDADAAGSAAGGYQGVGGAADEEEGGRFSASASASASGGAAANSDRSNSRRSSRASSVHSMRSRSRSPLPAAAAATVSAGGGGTGNRSASGSEGALSSSKGTSAVLYTLIFAVCALAVLLHSVSARLVLQITTLEDTLDSLQRHNRDRLLSLSNTLQRVEANSTASMQGAHALIDQQSSRITFLEGTVTRLSNRTTNADVIDRLQGTQDALNAQMHKQSASVTLQLQQAQTDMQSQLSKTRTELNETQTAVTSKMKTTLGAVDSLIAQANTDVKAAQTDIAAKLKAMQDLLANTLLRINSDISVAEGKINKDVELLQANVDAYVEVTNKQFAQEDDFVKYQLAGTFTLLSCLISLWHMSSHLRHYYKPEVQRRIMAVLWMVPVYSISSWLSLVLTEYAEIFGGMRDCYEAYAVYTFIAMLIAILEDGRGSRVFLRILTQHVAQEREELQDAIRDEREPLPKLHIVPPWRCCFDNTRPSQVARAWLYQCKLMAMQFVLIKPVVTLIPVICWAFNVQYKDR